ncbi:hypothetical protein DVH24_017677 [Malus domestica]|uniref:Uncharacterized protein n=1 Tax=Malus domestica TaxID=3750 RepID=A0A498KIR4_MALDO|nr:hypothetical protein DVH24_017677 [Malus domestica]
METKEGRSFIDKVIIKWYEDPEVLQMVKKRLLPSLEPETYRSWTKAFVIAPNRQHEGHHITVGQKKVKWFENPEILQIPKTMFDP